MQTETETLQQIPLVLNVIIKARNREDAISLLACRLNAWFVEDQNRKAPYPRGVLLLWGIFKEGEKTIG